MNLLSFLWADFTVYGSFNLLKIGITHNTNIGVHLYASYIHVYAYDRGHKNVLLTFMYRNS